MLITVFVFIGIEGASVYSRYAKTRKDVGTATVLGFVAVTGLMVAVTLLPYAIAPRAEIAGLRQPSLAGALELTVGAWGSWFISIGVPVSYTHLDVYKRQLWVQVPMIADRAGYGLWLLQKYGGLPELFTTFEKSFVCLPRLLHILALAYVLSAWPVVKTLAGDPRLSPIVMLGRHSLPVFAAGTILAYICLLYTSRCV